MTRKNSYDAIRLFAAVLVLFGHSFALTGHGAPGSSYISLGELGVWTFFILSGYLISKSWDQYPRLNIFLAKRALRIFPGLIVAVLVTIAICGLFFTNLPLIDYLLHQETWTYLNNILLFNGAFILPGVFSDNIYPLGVNGSLWTLAYEFAMYIAVAVIGVLKLYKKIPPIAFWLVLFISVLFVSTVGERLATLSIFYLVLEHFLTFALVFFSGVMMYKYEERIKLSYLAGAASLVAFIGLSVLFSDLTPLFGATLLAYALFSLGRSSILSGVSKFGDFSYGLYIYAFPIQQMIGALTLTQDPYKMFALSLVLSFLVAILSWHFVESRALKLKSKINPKRYPLDKTDKAW